MAWFSVIVLMLAQIATPTSRDTQPRVSVSVTSAKLVPCGNSYILRTILDIAIKNRSPEALVLGSVDVPQERLWRTKGSELELIRTTDTLDEFDDPDAFFSSIREQSLSKDSSKTLSVPHSVYLGAKDIQRDGKAWKVIVSFLVTNVRRDGSVTEYWGAPITISIPGGPDYQGERRCTTAPLQPKGVDKQQTTSH